MEDEKIISASSESLIWEQVELEFKKDAEPLEYHVVLEQHEKRILLDIQNNHDVGFRAEASTVLSSYLFSRNNFRFAIHKQGFIDEIGKFLGMQDCILGFKEFDERFVVKTNNEERVTTIFNDGKARQVLLGLPNLIFGIVEYVMEDTDGKVPFLELKIDAAITDVDRLRAIYTVFYNALIITES
jgi:hypothetical protein